MKRLFEDGCVLDMPHTSGCLCCSVLEVYVCLMLLRIRSDPYFLSYFVTPMLREIILMLDPLTPLPVVGRSGDRLVIENANHDRQVPGHIAIFSAHDVTLLGLLHGLKANVVYDSPDHWPDYGIIFFLNCIAEVHIYLRKYKTFANLL